MGPSLFFPFFANQSITSGFRAGSNKLITPAKAKVNRTVMSDLTVHIELKSRNVTSVPFISLFTY